MGTQQNTDAVCFGETMALLVPDPPELGAHAATFRREMGGAESNVAIQLAREGRSVAWHGVLGADSFGDYVYRRLASEGVRCGIRRDPALLTGLYLKELTPGGTTVRYYRQGSAGATLNPADAEPILRRKPRLIHTSGITPVLSRTAGELVAGLLAERTPKILRSFDVNYRPALHGPHNAGELLDLARAADVVFCGLDEARALWGAETVPRARELLSGPGLVVIKQGADGVRAFAGDESWYEPAPDVPVVEPVGAGDAFAAGFLHRLLDGAPVPGCLAEGARLAGHALQVHGDIPAVRHDGDGTVQHRKAATT